jgi:hypothetical protein
MLSGHYCQWGGRVGDRDTDISVTAGIGLCITEDDVLTTRPIWPYSEGQERAVKRHRAILRVWWCCPQAGHYLEVWCSGRFVTLQTLPAQSDRKGHGPRDIRCAHRTDIIFRLVLPNLYTARSQCASIPVRTDQEGDERNKQGLIERLTMKNGFFWDVTPCGSCKNGRFGET